MVVTLVGLSVDQVRRIDSLVEQHKVESQRDTYETFAEWRKVVRQEWAIDYWNSLQGDDYWKGVESGMKLSEPIFKATHRLREYPHCEVMVTTVSETHLYFTGAYQDRRHWIGNEKFNEMYEPLECKESKL